MPEAAAYSSTTTEDQHVVKMTNPGKALKKLQVQIKKNYKSRLKKAEVTIHVNSVSEGNESLTMSETDF